MNILTKREFTEITPEKAESFLQHNSYAVQRKLRPAHLTELASKMERGLFRFGEIALAHQNGSTYMMNGQHVCNAIIKTGLPQICVVEEFKAETHRDLSVLFQQFENLARSLKDMVRVEQNALKIEWPDRISQLVVSSASIIEANNFKFTGTAGPGSERAASKYMSKETKVGFLKKYLVEGSFINDIIVADGTGDPKHMMRAAVGAMMILTWKKSKEDAYVFWKQVRDGERLTRKMPTWHLREFLTHHNTIAYRNNFTYRKATNHEIGYRVALTWNAFRKDREISKTSYFPEKPIPQLK